MSLNPVAEEASIAVQPDDALPMPFTTGLALLGVALSTVLAIDLNARFHPPNLSLVFVLPVVLAAAAGGWIPAMVAAVASVLAYNFFLIEPLYTLRVADPANAWALALLLAVASIVSAVGSQARRRALEARRAASEATALQALARGLVGETSRAGLARRCADALSKLFQVPAVVWFETDGLEPAARAGGASFTQADLAAAQLCLASGVTMRGGAYPVGDARFDFWPLTTPQRQRAVLGVRLSGGEGGRPDAPEGQVDAIAAYLSVALDREALAAQALEGRVRAAGDRLKSDLLAAVSHDLRTPLSTILVTLQSLQRFAGRYDAAAQAELLASAEAEASRLNRMVENLLDMNRLEAGATPIHLAPTSPAEVAAAALARAGLGQHQIVNEVAATPPLMIDPAMFETALSNVLENAGKYAPPGTKIRLRSGVDGSLGWIEVTDEGPGFLGPPEPLFERFARGVQGDGRAPGTGLGLSIARGFLEAQGGRVEAADRMDGAGAWVRLSAPLASA